MPELGGAELGSGWLRPHIGEPSASLGRSSFVGSEKLHNAVEIERLIDVAVAHPSVVCKCQDFESGVSIWSNKSEHEPLPVPHQGERRIAINRSLQFVEACLDLRGDLTYSLGISLFGIKRQDLSVVGGLDDQRAQNASFARLAETTAPECWSQRSARNSPDGVSQILFVISVTKEIVAGTKAHESPGALPPCGCRSALLESQACLIVWLPEISSPAPAMASPLRSIELCVGPTRGDQLATEAHDHGASRIPLQAHGSASLGFSWVSDY